MDSAGNKIRQTVKDGQLFSTVIEQVGEEAKLWAQIEKEQKEAREEERQIMKDLISEQKEYIAAQERINKAQEEMVRRTRERDYSLLFDQLDQKDQAQYLSSLDRQVQQTKELGIVEAKYVATSNRKERDSYALQVADIRRKLNAEKQISSELVNQNRSLSKNESVVQRLKVLAEARKTGEKQVAAAQKEQEEKLKSVSTFYDQILRSMTHMMVMWASNALKSFWSDAQDYAKSYYDQLNEIRIVTGTNEEQANRMGQTYRSMAKEMSVSSSEIAKAAVEFWRQGLGETEVNSRQVNTTKYAKIAALEFDEAAELVTAATNSMNQDAQRVVDVFAYLGDASASGADEIGIAMQKASATAEEAGQSFEWLGAYIATISEKTRQAPEVIGTSLNSMMSRLQSIKQMGYNEEDETKINDISKALSNIDVALMDNQGNWRNMNDIFMDIALQWDSLNDKTRSYIATTLAGTRQKNYFLTLMDDLRKVASTTGEASRAMELYEGAMNSAGTASEKYAVYQESIAAAHDKMKASFEQLFSLLDSDTIKKWYEFLGQAADGWALVLSGGKITPSIDYTSVIDDLNGEINTITPQIKEYEQLYRSKNRTTEQTQRMEEIVQTLSNEYLPLQKSLKNANGEFKSGAEAIKAMNAELEYAIDIKREYEKQNLFKEAMDISGIQEIIAMREQYQSRQDLASLIAQGSSDFGYGDITSLSQDRMNTLGGELNKNMKMSSSWLKRLYPDKQEREEVLAAWNEFYEDYWDKMAYGYNTLRTQTMQQIEAAGDSVLNTSAIRIIDSFLAFESFDSLGETAKTEARKIAQSIADGITEADWSIGEDYVHSLLYNRSNEALAMYKKVYQDVQSWMASGSDENMRYNLETEISAFNTMFGMSLSLDGIMANLGSATGNLEGNIDNAEKRMSRLQSLADDVWANINAKNQSDKIAGFSTEGWTKQLSLMERALNEALKGNGSGWAESIMAAWLGNEEMYKAMMSDFNWFDDFALAMKDGNFTEAMQIMQDGMDKTKEKAESLGEALKNSLASQELEALTESGFASWFEEMSKFAETGDEAGLYGWLLGKDDEQLKAFIEAFPIFSEFLNSIVEGKGAVDESSESWALFSENIGNATNKYLEWLEAYKTSQESEVTDEEGRGLLKSLSSAYDKDGIKGYKKEFESMTDAQRNWIVKNSEAGKQMVEIMEDGTDATKDGASAMKKMNREIGRMDLDDLVDAGDVWEDIPDMLDAAAKGGKDFSDAYSDAVGEVEKLSEAQGALAAIQNGTLKSADDLDDAYSTLASYTGLSADSLRNDLSPALWMINNDTAQASNSVAYLANWLANAAGVQFTASNWQSQLAALMGSADETTAHVATLVNTMLKAAGSSLYMSGNTVKVKWGSGSFTPASARSGGGRRSGGGSSGSNSSNEMSEIEKMLDLMKQIQDIRDHQMDLIQEARSYYETTGELQGVIKYYEKERDAVLDNNKVLEENIAKIESLMFAKQKEVASMSTSDDAYEQAAKDLEGLQEAHQEYTQQLLENRTAVEELTQSIKEQQDEIRDMEIELRDTILDAIKDREELNERMLQGTIDVENEILDIIKARYEKERDEIIETSEAKREALEQEKDLLDEQLEARKKAAEQEDKQLKLKQLQAKLERISADPTRKKEELELRKEIAELRNEMAWDLAEEEVESQKESIDQQIDSLDEYIQYVEDYYEDLFKHPQKLIEEMKSIISKTDAEIIEFLKQNSEDYAASTEAAQQSMVNSWNDMLMDMHGSIEDYWDEVEQIIAGGNDAIIEFLKQNSADYKEAGKLQAEAYVDQWKKQLEDLRKAHKEVTDEINNTKYDVVKPSTGNSNSGGSGGGSGGSSSSSSNPTAPQWYLTINGKKTGNPVSTESEAARMAYLERTYGVQSGKYKPTDIISYARYKKGGLANFTGLAWLDGTKTKPERILSAYQTELFEDLIATLHGIKVFTNSMPSVGFDGANSGQTFTFGDIVINVDSLNNDSDYETIAEQIMEQIMDMMTRGSAVGGIRITR